MLISCRRVARGCSVGEVEVIREFCAIGGDSVDASHGWQYTMSLTQGTHAEIFALHVTLRVLRVTRYLEVRETESLSLAEYVSRKVLDLLILSEYASVIDDILQSLQEPGVDLRQLIDVLNRVSLL